MREFETVSEKKKSEARFFCLSDSKNAFFGDAGYEPDPKDPDFWKTKHQTGHEPPREPGFLGFKTNSSGSTIPMCLRFSTTIQSVTTKNRFQRLSGTARGCEIVNSDNPTSWIASLFALVERTKHLKCPTKHLTLLDARLSHLTIPNSLFDSSHYFMANA